MGEAVLALHRAGERMYALSQLRTGSIRDQILRACMLCDALLAGGLVRTGDRQGGLLIAGAGVAGCMLALRASARGVHVTLLEDAAPLHTQLTADSRVIDPLEFDWPQPHWTHGTFPIPHGTAMQPTSAAPPPVRFTTSTAVQLGVAWQSVLIDWISHHAGHNGHGRLDLLPRRFRTGSLVPLGGRVSMGGLLWQDAQATERAYHGAAVDCTGFGSENVTAPAGGFAGRPFWAADRLDELKTAPASGGRHRVVVSGGGDGAMQDLLRCCTGTFGRALADALQLQVPDAHRFALQAIEDASRRAHAWAGPGTPDDGLLQRWHAPYLAAAADIWQAWGAAGAQARLALLSPTAATWVLRSRWPTHCYGLNRLLVLLVARLVGLRDHRPWCTVWDGGRPLADAVIQPGTELLRVECRHPPAASAPACVDPCFGLPHRVDLQPGGMVQADLVIIRHGIVRQAPAFGRAAELPEQLVPYDLG